MSKRTIGIVAAIAGLLLLVVVALGSGDDEKRYQVRAIFRNASFAIQGEDVKIAGAKVGSIDSLDITPNGQAAIVLNIDDPAFQDFRSDAECAIRLQSVIGEKLIECQPTMPRAEGAPKAPPLKTIPKGLPGAGQHLLTEAHTTTPVDVDLINDIQRLPIRQRFTILLNEFGAGLAGRGEDLRKAIREADPALKQVDRVLKILADQNRTLADLAVDGDKVVSALAKNREQVADFIVQANTTAQATAERGADLERNFQKFPAFLRELKPTMERLGALSDEMLPVVTDLGANGSDVSRFLINLGPFSRNAVPAFQSLGDTADVGGPALKTAQPVIQLLALFASKSRPLSSNLKSLATHLKANDAIERAMDVVYYAALATNGFDQFGHYLRTSPNSNCVAYNGTAAQCRARWGTGASSASISAAGVTPLAEAFRTPQAGDSGSTTKDGETSKGATGATGATGKTPVIPAPPADQQAAGEQPASGASARSRRNREVLLDYLLGSDSK